MSFMKKMLTKPILTRLTKLPLIKVEPFFRNFNWDGMLSFSLEPPNLPKITDDFRLNKGDKPPVAFVNYLRTLKEFKPKKSPHINKKTQLEYDEWFRKF
jgi:hypothetical protein